MEALHEKMAALAATYACRIQCGNTLAEHEAMCYMSVCRAIEAFARFQTAIWTEQAWVVEKRVEAERSKEEDL